MFHDSKNSILIQDIGDRVFIGLCPQDILFPICYKEVRSGHYLFRMTGFIMTFSYMHITNSDCIYVVHLLLTSLSLLFIYSRPSGCLTLLLGLSLKCKHCICTKMCYWPF
uniref:Uncharacterized protein n=1 Tax=Mus musculus TaxID=10090 RepID=Q8CBJ6_MOUSE|nr:unnamed protein product [Mus musculus]